MTSTYKGFPKEWPPIRINPFDNFDLAYRNTRDALSSVNDLRKILTSVFENLQPIDVRKDFGAKGDGSTDNQAALEEAFAVPGPKTILFPPSSSAYLHSGKLSPPSDTTIIGYGATLKASSALALSTSGVDFQTVSKVGIIGLKIDGNVSARSGSNGGAEVLFTNTNDYFLRDVEIVNPAHDGISVGYLDIADGDTRCFRGRWDNIKIEAAFRNGISIDGAVDLIGINVAANNTLGTAPEAGIDIEADAAAIRNENVRFYNVRCDGNNGNGFLLCSDVFSIDCSVNGGNFNDNGVFGISQPRVSNFGIGCENISGSGNTSGLFGVYAYDRADDANNHRIIQTAYGSETGPDSFTTGVFVDGSLSVSITPIYPNSKIKGILRCAGNVTSTNASSVQGTLRVLYTGTPAQVGKSSEVRLQVGGNGANTLTQFTDPIIMFEDDVDVVGVARTYIVQGRLDAGDSMTLSNYELLLMEIPA